MCPVFFTLKRLDILEYNNEDFKKPVREERRIAVIVLSDEKTVCIAV